MVACGFINPSSNLFTHKLKSALNCFCTKTTAEQEGGEFSLQWDVLTCFLQAVTEPGAEPGTTIIAQFPAHGDRKLKHRNKYFRHHFQTEPVEPFHS